MTQNQPGSPEQQATPEETMMPTEPLYGPEDVARALQSSGERALANAYFITEGKTGVTKAEADQIIAQIQSGQSVQPGQLMVDPLQQSTEEPQPAQDAEGGTA
jgi:hypothetical protein